MPNDIDYLLEGDPRETIRWQRKNDIWGDPIFGSRATVAQLEDTDQRCLAQFGVGFEVMQGCFNTDVALSAGTHDFDRCVDGFIPRVDWLVAQRFLRGPCRWFCWYRKPPTFSSHIHACASHTYDTRVGEFVPGQMADYVAKPPLDGLAGTTLDLTWHPDPILRFDYEQWKQDNMELSSEQITAIADKTVAKLLATELTLSDGTVVSFQQAQRRAAQYAPKLDAISAQVVDLSTSVASVKQKVNASRSEIMTKLGVIDDQVG